MDWLKWMGLNKIRLFWTDADWAALALRLAGYGRAVTEIEVPLPSLKMCFFKIIYRK